MTLGQRIQQIRIEHGLSQEEFAEKLGTTRQTISRWELDQTFPEIAKNVMISKIFIPRLAAKRGINEDLKAHNALRWVEEMNNIKACMEEMILREVVYQ